MELENKLHSSYDDKDAPLNLPTRKSVFLKIGTVPDEATGFFS
jgi:hypothetical protein